MVFHSHYGLPDDHPFPPTTAGTARKPIERSIANVFLEVIRAVDNLNKSGKLFNPASRRESMPMMGAGRSMSDFGTHASNRVPLLTKLRVQTRSSDGGYAAASTLNRRLRSATFPLWLKPAELLCQPASPTTPKRSRTDVTSKAPYGCSA